ncbi:MAG: single-stranded DNA-binding protein [Arcobacteraceae bacterium]
MYNKVVMIGNLTRDIELKYLPSGSAIAKSAIATSYKYKASTGEQKDEVCFLDFNIFGRTAEVANQYLRKGSKVLLEGRLVLEQWTGQDGSNRSKHSLRVDTMKMLDSKQDSQNSSEYSSGDYGQQNASAYNNVQQPNNYGNAQASGGMAGNASMQASHAIPEIDIDEDEIPF